MDKLNITLSQSQANELLDISMTSFKEASLLQSIKDSNIWWEELIGYYPSRVERVEGLTFSITID